MPGSGRDRCVASSVTWSLVWHMLGQLLQIGVPAAADIIMLRSTAVALEASLEAKGCQSIWESGYFSATM